MRAAHAANAMTGNATAKGLHPPVSCRKSRSDANHAREAHDWRTCQAFKECIIVPMTLRYPFIGDSSL